MRMHVMVNSAPRKSKDRRAQTEVFVDLAVLGDASVGRRIRAYRKLAGLSQEEVARSAGLLPIDVSRLEQRPQCAKLRVFAAVCKVLGCTLADIVEDVPEAVI